MNGSTSGDLGQGYVVQSITASVSFGNEGSPTLVSNTDATANRAPPKAHPAKEDLRSQYLAALELSKRGEPDKAETLCEKIIGADTNNFDALHLLAALTLGKGKVQEAIDLFVRAVAINPADAFAHSNMASALLDGGRPAEALASTDLALALRPGLPEGLYNRANSLSALGKHEDALEGYNLALRSRPHYVDALINHALELMHFDRFDEALADCDKALRIAPDSIKALVNRGAILLSLERPRDALWSFTRVLALTPSLPEALIGKGNALHRLGRLENALESYHKASAIKPDSGEILALRAAVLMDLGRPTEALANYDTALSTHETIPVLEGRQRALYRLGRYEDAALNASRILEIDPSLDCALGTLFYLKLHCCDWSAYTETRKTIVEVVRKGGFADAPFHFLFVSDSPEYQLCCAQAATAKYHPSKEPVWTGEQYTHRKIRVAYVSGTFSGQMTTDLFELHDKQNFDPIGISFGPKLERDDVRRRLEGAFSQFIDVSGLSDRDAAGLLKELEVDIAVDLNGWTTVDLNGSTARGLGIFAYRPAPLQVTYLGYPGTTGASYIDYILGDSIVIPEKHQSSYSERIVYLPECYQVNDFRRETIAQSNDRTVAGLPDKGFVFCCFNGPHTISPSIFSVWMALLKQVSGSVLWLAVTNETATQNLRAAAARHGVSPHRLIFAAHVDHAERMARYCLADLFLDTLPVNAQMTASDALWMGLPVVTCTGSAFAGRVVSSLLLAIGLSELVTTTFEEYQALALRLSSSPALLADIRDRLARGRETRSLFNTDRFRRHLESAFVAMWERQQRGEPPESFSVLPIS